MAVALQGRRTGRGCVSESYVLHETIYIYTLPTYVLQYVVHTQDTFVHSLTCRGIRSVRARSRRTVPSRAGHHEIPPHIFSPALHPPGSWGSMQRGRDERRRSQRQRDRLPQRLLGVVGLSSQGATICTECSVQCRLPEHLRPAFPILTCRFPRVLMNGAERRTVPWTYFRGT